MHPAIEVSERGWLTYLLTSTSGYVALAVLCWMLIVLALLPLAVVQHTEMGFVVNMLVAAQLMRTLLWSTVWTRTRTVMLALSAYILARCVQKTVQGVPAYISPTSADAMLLWIVVATAAMVPAAICSELKEQHSNRRNVALVRLYHNAACAA